MSRSGKQWAKVWRDSSQSKRLRALLNCDRLAAALFWPLKAHCDDFGRCTADPDRLALLLCAGSMIDGAVTMGELEAALAAMAECGCIRRYEVEGEPYLEVIDYHNHEDPQWRFVGGPEYPPPLDWTPPASLVAFIAGHHSDRNVCCARYGITEANCPPELMSVLRSEQSSGETSGVVQQPSDDSSAAAEPPLNHRSTTVQPPLNDHSTTVEPPFSPGEQTQTQTQTQTKQETPPAPPCQGGTRSEGRIGEELDVPSDLPQGFLYTADGGIEGRVGDCPELTQLIGDAQALESTIHFDQRLPQFLRHVERRYRKSWVKELALHIARGFSDAETLLDALSRPELGPQTPGELKHPDWWLDHLPGRRRAVEREKGSTGNPYLDSLPELPQEHYREGE